MSVMGLVVVPVRSRFAPLFAFDGTPDFHVGRNPAHSGSRLAQVLRARRDHSPPERVHFRDQALCSSCTSQVAVHRGSGKAELSHMFEEQHERVNVMCSLRAYRCRVLG